MNEDYLITMFFDSGMDLEIEEVNGGLSIEAYHSDSQKCTMICDFILPNDEELIENLLLELLGVFDFSFTVEFKCIVDLEKFLTTFTCE